MSLNGSQVPENNKHTLCPGTEVELHREKCVSRSLQHAFSLLVLQAVTLSISRGKRDDGSILGGKESNSGGTILWAQWLE